MRKTVLGLLLGLGALAVGCDLLDPGSTKGEIQVNDTYVTSGSACNIWCNLDGNYAVTLAYGQLYTFPLTASGSHTVNFGTYGGCSGSSSCPINSGSAGATTYSDTFQVNAGDLYVIKIAQGSSCNDYTITGP